MTRFTKFLLVACATLIPFQGFAAQATAANTMAPAERAKIEEVIHQYLIQKPEILIEAMQVLQRRQYEQAEQTVKQTQSTAGKYVSSLFHMNADPAIGNPNGKITIVEFFDYQCPHCIDMAPVMAAIVKANPEVRVIYKEFPIRGPASEFAARAALAANKQGKYYDFSIAMLNAKQPLNPDAVYQIAKDHGIDVEKLKKDANSEEVTKQIKDNVKLAQDLKLFGTPALFIGATDAKPTDAINYMPGKVTQEQLQEAINKANG